MLRRKVIQGVVVASLVAGLFSVFGASSARADVSLTVSPAVYRSGGTSANGAGIQLAGHWHGYGGYGGYGWGGGYRGGYYGGPAIGVYAPVYRRYPGFGAPVYVAPVYAPPVYGYPAVGYPAYGYGPGYGYGGCW